MTWQSGLTARLSSFGARTAVSDTPHLQLLGVSVAPPMLPDAFRGLRDKANADEQFRLESQGMDRAIVLDIADSSVLVEIGDGSIRAVKPSFQFSSSDVRLRCDAETWDRYRADSPPPYYQDLRSIWINHGLTVEGDQVLALRYWGAMKRLVQLVAEGWNDD